MLRHVVYGTIAFLCTLVVHMEEECEPGKYGNRCNQNCSRNCASLPNNIVRCHQDTGECFEGCRVGVYGDQCDHDCSGNCKDHTCHQKTGHCTWGCTDNRIGDFCETVQEITIVHEGTTYSSHGTVTTGVAVTGQPNVIIPVVVTVLVLIIVLILVGVVTICICFIFSRRGTEETRSKEVDNDQEKQGFVQNATASGEGDTAKSEREALRPGPTQESGVHASSGEGDTGKSGTPTRSREGDTATPTAARRDVQAENDLHDACFGGNLAEVKRILDTGRADVNRRDVGGMTPVMWAAWIEHGGVVELLVRHGADVSLVDGVGRNILHHACWGGDRETVEFVLSLDGVDVNDRDNEGQTAADLARDWGHHQLLDLLESRGAVK